MIKWLKNLLKLNKEKKEEKHVITIDTVLEWTVYIEEYGA